MKFGKINRDRNPRNPQTSLYRKLTRLLSGPIVRHRSQSERKLRRKNYQKYAKRFVSASGMKFKREEYNPFGALQAHYMENQARMERYSDFDQMEYSFIGTIMDIYADEMTTCSSLQPVLTVDCANEEIKFVLQSLYRDILQAEFNLYGWCRTTCKFGDFFLYLDIDEEKGVQSAVGLPAQEVERLENLDKNNPEYVQYQWNAGGLTFENWQIAHFRILGNDKFAPYGTSVLDPARRTWRQLLLIEDAMMAYRIVRAPERRVFYIDVGDLGPEETEQYMERAITTLKRHQVVDADTGEIDRRHNPMSIEEDYYIPVRGGENNTKIETLPGGQYTGDIDDVNYIKDKIFAALKVPQSYLFSSEGAEDKTTLAQKDIRFARTIQRLQRSVICELEKIGIVHLYILGYREKDLVNFQLKMNNPSKIAELQELEHWRTKFEVASSATEGFFSRRWVAENLFGLTNEEFLRCQREMFYDNLLDVKLNEMESEGIDGGGFGGMGGGGDEGLEDVALTDEEEMGPEDEMGDESGDDDDLLVDPGSDIKGKRKSLRDNKKKDKRSFGARKRS